MADIFDLDALVPEPRKVKINGKLIECRPLTVRQMIQVAKLEVELSRVQSPDDILPKIQEAFAPFMPAIMDEDIDFTIEQLRTLIQFAQTGAIPETATRAQAYPVKKNESSPEASPTSSVDTPATPSETS